MTLLLIIASAIFTLVATYHLVLPFLSSHEESLRFEVLDDDLRKVEELVARKTTLLQTLRDVEFDYETSKISEDDYRELKRRYERQAVEVMRELDNLHGGRGWEDAIDAELDQRLAKLQAERQTDRQTVRHAEQPREVAAAQPAELVDCPDCGKEMEANARFCSQCGSTLAESGRADSGRADSGRADSGRADSGLNKRSADNEADENNAPMESRALPNSGSEVAT